MSNPPPPYPNPQAGAYVPQQGYGTGYPNVPSYQTNTYYQQPVQQVVYVDETDRREAEDAQCCLLACCWALLCCCFLGNS